MRILFTGFALLVCGCRICQKRKNWTASFAHLCRISVCRSNCGAPTTSTRRRRLQNAPMRSSRALLATMRRSLDRKSRNGDTRSVHLHRRKPVDKLRRVAGAEGQSPWSWGQPVAGRFRGRNTKNCAPNGRVSSAKSRAI